MAPLQPLMADLLDMEIIGRIPGVARSIALGRLPFCEYYVPILVPVRVPQILRKLITVRGNIFTIPFAKTC